MKALVPLLLLGVTLLTGCSSVQTHRNPGVDLARYQRFYVEHRLTDDRHLDEMIVARLHELGREASFGPLTMMPEDTQVVVTYEDAWAWDFKNYLIELNIQFRSARKDRGLAYGGYRQPSMITKSPEEVVSLILTPLFSKR
jgi:hypothetical protein